MLRGLSLVVAAAVLSISSVTYAQLGACCLPNGDCIETTQDRCDVVGGKFFPGERCSDIKCDNVERGACCVEVGGVRRCIDEATREACDQADGKFFPGQKCSDINCEAPPVEGACCLPDGSCVETTAEKCRDGNGRFFPNTPCDQAPCNVEPSQCLYIVKKVRAKKECRTCPIQVGEIVCGERCETGQDCRKKFKTKVPCSNGQPGFCKVKAKLIGCDRCPR